MIKKTARVQPGKAVSKIQEVDPGKPAREKPAKHLMKKNKTKMRKTRKSVKKDVREAKVTAPLQVVNPAKADRSADNKIQISIAAKIQDNARNNKEEAKILWVN